MARDYVINGETLVRVKFGDHVNPTVSGTPPIFELGLSDGPIRVIPDWQYLDLHADDFGPTVPPEILWQGGTATILMTLVHFDLAVLQTCLGEAQGGLQTDVFGTLDEGTLGPFGVPLGHGLPLYNSGNHHIGLELSSPVQGLPWTFAACHLASPPVIVPLGTERSLAEVRWRSIPYVPATVVSGSFLVISGATGNIPEPQEVLSSGVLLYDHVADNIP